MFSEVAVAIVVASVKGGTPSPESGVFAPASNPIIVMVRDNRISPWTCGF